MMAEVIHMTEDEATQIVVSLRKLLPTTTKMHQTYFWSLIKQIQKTFGIVWREDKQMFMRPDPE